MRTFSPTNSAGTTTTAKVLIGASRNPPFKLLHEFIERALDVARHGAAMLVRTQALEGKRRHDLIYSKRRPAIIAPFVERVPMVQGRCDEKATTATSYCWLTWLNGETNRSTQVTQVTWIPPCHKQLERPGDYNLPAKVQ